jgi:hypothetical protein
MKGVEASGLFLLLLFLFLSMKWDDIFVSSDAIDGIKCGILSTQQQPQPAQR